MWSKVGFGLLLFAWLIVFHLQFVITWIYFAVVGIFFFSKDPSHIYGVWILAAVGALYLLYCWVIILVNYNKGDSIPSWFRWDWDV